MEDEALDTRGRNLTLIIFGGIVLVIVLLVANNYRVKLDRITGMKSADAARQRAKVKEMMAGFTNDGAVAEQLQGERPSVRMAAVRALHALKDDPDEKARKDAARLLVPFMKDSDQPIKDLAVQELTDLGPGTAMEAVINALADSDGSVKANAQTVVQNFAGDSLAPLLAFSGKEGAGAVLRTTKRAAAGNAMVEIAKKDPRYKTVLILGQEAVNAAARKLTPPQAQAELQKFLGLDHPLLSVPTESIYGVVDYLPPANANEDDQNNAISILDRFGDTRAVPYLIPRLDPPPTRRAAVGALGRLADKRATERLVHYLPLDETNRLEIVIALGRIADPAAASPLVQYGLASVSQPVRAAAADSLRNIGLPAVPQLVAAAKASDPADPAFYKAEGAVRALAGIKDPTATQVAIAALKHPSSNVREAAAASLADSASPSAIAPLIASFEDPDGRVSGFAARSVSAFGMQAVTPLAAALSDPKRVYWASLATAYIGQGAVPALQQLVLQGDVHGALAAAKLLGDLGDAHAIAALKQARDQRPDPDFKFAADSSIQRLGGA